MTDMRNGLLTIAEEIERQIGENPGQNVAARFENNIFSMRSFCWGCAYCDNLDEGQSDCYPNFHHKQTGIMVRWYKHIGRGMETNMESDDTWASVVADCILSLQKVDQVPFWIPL